MRLEDLRVGYHYYISDLSYTVHTASEEYFEKEHQNIFKDAWELLEKGGEYPTSKNPNPCSCFMPKPNDVKLRHRATCIVLYINALHLSKNKPSGLPAHYTNCNVNNTERLYDYSLSSPYNLSNNSLKNTPKLQLQVQEILPDKYSPENIQDTYDKAVQQEFKIEKRTREEKIILILAKLKFIIENSLDKNNKQRFLISTKRYNMIKNLIK